LRNKQKKEWLIKAEKFIIRICLFEINDYYQKSTIMCCEDLALQDCKAFDLKNKP
jgi:hypothetical protein